jgi:hypothetical protein
MPEEIIPPIKHGKSPRRCFRSIAFGAALAFILLTPLAGPAQAQAAAGAGGGVVSSAQIYAMSWVTWLGSWVSWTESEISAEATAFRNAIVKDAQGLEDLIARTGFDVAEIRVGVGLIPSVGLGVDYKRALPPEERKALIDHVENSGEVGFIERVLVYALLDVADSEYVRANGNFALSSVDVDVDLVPGITLILSKGG